MITSLYNSFRLAFLCLLFVGCSWQQSPQPSILVILVENLGFNAFTCGEEAQAKKTSGFQSFCEESVRFTHAYTPSMMSNATIASILTERYPMLHGVRQNGAQFLSAKFETAAEAALRQGFRTSFFSGGVPVLRKAGINQGFETFDDFVQPNLKSLYRSAADNINLFLGWRDSETPRQKYFSFLYLNDLQFVDTPTTNELGEVRESSYKSQLEELGTSLGNLVKQMKQRKIWDSTNVFLVGLDGYSEELHTHETRPLNLYSEGTHVSLFIKPARKVRESAFNWKVDSSVTLVDVGATLFDLLGSKSPPPDFFAKVVSLKSVLTGPQPDWEEDRLVMSESAWAQWRGLGVIRYAIRRGPFLYMHENPIKIFNTLTDKSELTPLPQTDPLFADLHMTLAKEFRNLSLPYWVPLTPVTRDKFALAEELFSGAPPFAESLEHLDNLSKKSPQDPILRGWRAIWALRLEHWSDLKRIAAKPMQQDWNYVAERNLDQYKKLHPPIDPCFSFLRSESKTLETATLRDCVQPEVAAFIAWNEEPASSPQKSKLQETFLRTLSVRVLEQRIQEENYNVGLTWDVSLAKPDGPAMIDLILALPENKKLRPTLKPLRENQ